MWSIIREFWAGLLDIPLGAPLVDDKGLLNIIRTGQKIKTLVPSSAILSLAILQESILLWQTTGMEANMQQTHQRQSHLTARTQHWTINLYYSLYIYCKIIMWNKKCVTWPVEHDTMHGWNKDCSDWSVPQSMTLLVIAFHQFYVHFTELTIPMLLLFSFFSQVSEVEQKLAK